MLIAYHVIDLVIARIDPVPSWLRQLRAVLTFVATTALLGASLT